MIINLCNCGCGEPTNIRRGKPQRFVYGHHQRMDKKTIEPKLCECGCGEFTNIRSRKRHKFLAGHYAKSKRNKLIPQLCACGCGKITKIRWGYYNKYIFGHGNSKNSNTTLLDVEKLRNKYNKIAALTGSPFLGERESAQIKANEFEFLIKYAKELQKKPKDKKQDDTDPDVLERMLRDLYNYGSHPHRVPTKQIESPKMDAKYIPHIDTPSCPVCNLPNIDREPLLQKATGIRWYCWQCKGFFVKGSDGKFRKIIEVSQPIQTINDNDDDDPSNPGNYQGQHKGKKIFGSGSNPPFGTPGKPRVVP